MSAPQFTVEQVLLAVGKQAGHEDITYGSQMNKAIDSSCLFREGWPSMICCWYFAFIYVLNIHHYVWVSCFIHNENRLIRFGKFANRCSRTWMTLWRFRKCLSKFLKKILIQCCNVGSGSMKFWTQMLVLPSQRPGGGQRYSWATHSDSSEEQRAVDGSAVEQAPDEQRAADNGKWRFSAQSKHSKHFTELVRSPIHTSMFF